MYLQEGESLSRFFTCRLQPCHHDTRAQQLDLFPGLRGLTEAQLLSLQAKLTFTGEASFVQYYLSMLSR